MAKKDENKKIQIDLEEFVDLLPAYLEQDKFIETNVEVEGMHCLVPAELVEYIIDKTGERPRHMGIS